MSCKSRPSRRALSRSWIDRSSAPSRRGGRILRRFAAISIPAADTLSRVDLSGVFLRRAKFQPEIESGVAGVRVVKHAGATSFRATSRDYARGAVKFFLRPRWERKAEVTFWRLKLTRVTAATTITARWLGRPLPPLLLPDLRPTAQRARINHEKQFPSGQPARRRALDADDAREIKRERERERGREGARAFISNKSDRAAFW